MGKRTVGIHQANFIPWLGFFSKLACSDVFVILDDALLSKKGGNWSNRVKLINGGVARWHTVPIRRDYHGFRACRDIEIVEGKDWRKKLLQAVRTNYGRCPFFGEAFPLFEEIVGCPAKGLVDYNVWGIRAVMRVLGMDEGKLRLASALGVESVATERLVDLTRTVGGEIYLCGAGSGGYLEEDLFKSGGARLAYHDFEHPVYEQCGGSGVEGFVSGLSVFDALFNVGVEVTKALIGVGGRR